MARYLNILKGLCAALAMASALGCAAAEPKQESPAVQDINPGEKTMISQPAPAPSQGAVEERNI